MIHIVLASFEIEAYAKLIQETKTTAAQVSAGTALAVAMTDLCERCDISSVRHRVCGSLPLKQDVYHKFQPKGNWKSVALLGMTEAAPYVAWRKIGETISFAKSGTILPNMLCLLRLETSEDAPEGGPGGLWLKRPNMRQRR